MDRPAQRGPHADLPQERPSCQGCKAQTGLKIQTPEQEFVTQTDWDEQLHGAWDDAKAETLEIAGQEIRGIYKAPKRKGVHKVQEYVDSSVDDEIRLLQGGDTPFAEQALQEAKAATQQRWHSGKQERDGQ